MVVLTHSPIPPSSSPLKLSGIQSLLIRASKWEPHTHTNRWSLHRMTALVTGGTRGIGRAIVEELAGLGAEVCARNKTQLHDCLREWRNEGFQVTASVCDVSNRHQREDLAAEVSSVFGGSLNILVNNVGTNIRKPMVEFTAEEFSTLMATNYESVFCLWHCIIEVCLSKEQQREQLVNSLEAWLVNGQRTTSGVMLLHLGTSKHPWWRGYCLA